MVRCLQNRIRRVVELDVQVYEQEMEKVRRDVRSVDLNIVGPEWVAYSLTKLIAQAFSPFFLFLLIFTILVNLLTVIWPKILSFSRGLTSIQEKISKMARICTI